MLKFDFPDVIFQKDSGAKIIPVRQKKKFPSKIVSKFSVFWTVFL